MHNLPPPQNGGLFQRLIRKITGDGGASGGGQGLFHLRSELARLQSSVAQLNTAYGRREIASIKSLLTEAGRSDFEAAVRDRVHTIPLPDGTVLCRVLGRYKMYVDAADRGLAPHLMMEGFWQYWITAFLCRNLDRGETAYDLEAGYGYYSLLMSELVGMQGRVVALEYNPWLYQLLNRNIILNGRNTVVVSHRILAAGQAATAQELPASLIEPSASTQQASPLAYGSANSCIAPTMTLDGLEQGSADLVLVSATALEHGALDGMRGLMDRSPSLRIIVQFNPDRCRTPRQTLKALSDRFPLRFIDFDARAKPISIEEVIKANSVTLFLSLTDPR